MIAFHKCTFSDVFINLKNAFPNVLTSVNLQYNWYPVDKREKYYNNIY